MDQKKSLVVLVNSKFSFNVGAAARALANMGFQKLVLISPRCAVNLKAYEGAAGAQHILDEVEVLKDWKEFSARHSDIYKIGFSARSGKSRATESFGLTLEKLDEKPMQKVALVFGAEDSGLSNEDFKFLDQVCELPTYSDFHSINLAQSVLLALFMIQDRKKSHKKKTPAGGALASVSFDLIKSWMESVGFRITSPKRNAAVTLFRLLTRAHPTAKEQQLLEKVLQQNIRKLSQNKTN